MSKKIKYYVGSIKETNGNIDYCTQFLFKTSSEPDRYIERVASDWRGKEKFDKDYGGYWFDNTLISNDGYTEMSQEDFEIVRKYMSVLWTK